MRFKILQFQLFNDQVRSVYMNCFLRRFSAPFSGFGARFRRVNSFVGSSILQIRDEDREETDNDKKTSVHRFFLCTLIAFSFGTLPASGPALD